MSNLDALKTKALLVRRMYDQLNAQQGRAAWTGKDFAMGFVGDVGDLQKLVMAKEGMRAVDDVDTKLAHELADCLWSIMVLADYYSVDLQKEFLQTMDGLVARIEKHQAEEK
jgi:hypothetical protein